MRLASGKFKHLDTVQAFLAPEIVPAFRVMTSLEGISDFPVPLILRSALRNEGEKHKLLSGKSLSIAGIDSRQKLEEAWEQVQGQPELEEVILQTEINWDSHLTLIYENDFFFVEIKKQNGPQEFIYWTPLGQSLSPDIQKLKDFITSIKSFLEQEKFWLMELGLKDGKLFLFQIHPVNLNLLSNIFSSEMVGQIVFSRMRFAKSQNLWGLLKMEWAARKFRQQMNQESFHPSLIFLNWEFLFHYYRLFCMMNQLRPDAQSFAKFLAMSYQKNWMSSLIKKHLELSNFFRKNETFDPMMLGFETQGPIYIGKGIVKGVVGQEIHVCETISLDLIYQKQRPKAILTKEVGILSHPVLASVENGVFLILGAAELPPQGARMFLDFDQKILRIE